MRFRRVFIGLWCFLYLTSVLRGQWEIQDAHTTASLRGIHYVGNGVAWASGTDGTVLRTEDMGFVWQLCTIPPGAEKLDFRGIQAFDNNTAIVMSSGKGDLSRLYKTTDGCQTWKLVAKNPDAQGFWDSVKFYDDANVSSKDPASALILGDSVGGKLKVWAWKEGWNDRELEPADELRGAAAVGEGSFAASNSVLDIATTPQVDKTWKWNYRFVSQILGHAYLSYVRSEATATCEPCRMEASRVEVPMATGAPGSGIFSFHFRTELIGIAVGGDYSKPNATAKTAAFSTDGGFIWKLAANLPNGYRSAVAYDLASRCWITVGPNGTDISTDDGRNWHPLKPGPGDASDADQHWNALSLPFVVGPKGRIGLLKTERLKAK